MVSYDARAPFPKYGETFDMSKTKISTMHWYAFVLVKSPVRGSFFRRIKIALRVLFKGEVHTWIKKDLFTKKGLKELYE